MPQNLIICQTRDVRLWYMVYYLQKLDDATINYYMYTESYRGVYVVSKACA
jgi:hypothetical protein